jgi:hypothetical protein
VRAACVDVTFDAVRQILCRPRLTFRGKSVLPRALAEKLLSELRAPTDLLVKVAHNPIPADATILAVMVEFNRPILRLVLESPQLKMLDQGQTYPKLDPVYRRIGPPAVVIEDLSEEGVKWGVSTDGPNPLQEHFTDCRDKDHAFEVKAAYDSQHSPS